MAGMTVTYQYPVTSAPTVAQMLKRQQLIATVASGAGANDDATDVVHSFNTSSTGADGQPVINVAMVAQGSAAVVPSVNYKDANTVTVTSNAKGANCNFTIQLTLERRE
jgi:hypothetical protein